MMVTLAELMPDVVFAPEVGARVVSSLIMDSRKVVPGAVFVALKGDRVDGRDYIDTAFSAGASAVLCEPDDRFPASVLQGDRPVVVVPGLGATLGFIAARFHGYPTRKLNVTAVTGTNGKTSFSHLLARALEKLHANAAVIGTLGNGRPSALTSTVFTTPDPLQLQELLARFVSSGITHLAMEASSHGLEQARMAGVDVQTAVFTNLTRDHLDYHGSMEAYSASKQKLFAWSGLKTAILNADDPASGDMRKAVADNVTVLTYGLETEADVRAARIKTSLAGLEVEVTTPWGDGVIHSALLGRFNVSNLLAVLTALLVQGYVLREAIAALSSVSPVAGRMQAIKQEGLPLVVVDYAHTPDALEKALSTLREHTDGKLLVVFGCGGDRDSGKRSIMAAISEKLADVVYVTNDNPRTENPESIITQILAGFSSKTPFVVPDRAAAIENAIMSATANDIVLVAGKGHEDYQEINGERFHFSDVEVARECLKKGVGK